MKEARVEDFDVHKDMSIDELVEKFSFMGGFTAKHVAEAVEILDRMFRDNECTVFLAFPASLVATGLRGVLAGLVKRRLIDVIITTGGTFDHDLARAWGGRYLIGSFYVDDLDLSKKGIHRLGSVFIPIEDYGPLLERGVVKVLDELYKNGRSRFSSRELAEEFGKRVEDEVSILRQAAINKVPVYSPGILDSALGTQLVIYSQTRKIELDLLRDEKELLDIAFSSKRLGALILGGGISKHHTLWFSQFKGGLDYAIYVTTAVEYDGSLSGARVREAITWSKVKRDARYVTVDGDATLILPIILASVYKRLKM